MQFAGLAMFTYVNMRNNRLAPVEEKKLQYTQNGPPIHGGNIVKS